MSPADGSWGAAERVVLTRQNSALDEIRRTFQACVEHPGYMIVEQRRSDCNFQIALLFLLAAELNHSSGDRRTAGNILEFLYHRSGLLNRYCERYPVGVWNWSHTRWEGIFWLDDNGWITALQMMIGSRYPELDKQYEMIKWGQTLAYELLAVFRRSFDTGTFTDPECRYNGNWNQPHWGILPVMAFAVAWKLTGDVQFKQAVYRYFEFLRQDRAGLNSSELSYALIGVTVAAAVFAEDASVLELAQGIGRQLTCTMADNNGVLPAEHVETPLGAHLVDLVYTFNWALLGFQNLAAMTGDDRVVRQMLTFATLIQDQSPEPYLNGCWRGMYDCGSHDWGGGDRYEGGGGSIYSGWTNAPISIALALALKNESLLDLLPEFSENRQLI